MKRKEPAKRKAGRPKVEIDWNRVGEMLEAGAFAKGIAATLGITEDTLYNRCKSDNKLDFSAYRQQKVAKGDELLREIQFKTAQTGNVTMQIWLGKQRLGQSDKSEVQTTIRKIQVEWLDGEQIIPGTNDGDTITDSIN